MSAPANNRPVELVAIINSFNRRALLEKAVSSLMPALRVAPFGSAVVVFEAGSTDGSKEFIESWREQNPNDRLIVVVPLPGQTSFSAGVNAGCATALAQYPECRWLFLYETDNWLAGAEPLTAAISLLEAQPRLGAAGFTVQQHNGNRVGHGMRFPSWFSLALGPNLASRSNLAGPNDSNWQVTDNVRWRTCDVVFTSPLLIRRETWEQIGGFDVQAFPFSDSDLDWAWRCAEADWGMAVIASDAVVHDNREQLSAWSANRVIDFHRSRLQLLKRHRSNRAALIKPILFLRHCLETLWLACRLGADPKARAKLAKRRQLLRTVWSDYRSASQ